MSQRSLRAILAVLLATFAFSASADEDSVINHRKGVYGAIGGNMKALVMIVKGGVPFAGDARYHAEQIATLSKMAEKVFPMGSDFGDTEAKPDIWSKPDDFKKVMAAFQAQAAKTAKTAAGGDLKATAAEVGELGKACKACHDNFRQQPKK